jgi:hypothetical protein
VALSLLAACSIAPLIAMALPWLLHRLGRDPAFGSGPLATVVQDLLSVGDLPGDCGDPGALSGADRSGHMRSGGEHPAMK